MITFTRRVGTAPGTTVLVENDGLSTLGVHQCVPEPMPIHLVRDQQRQPVDARLFPPVRWQSPKPYSWKAAPKPQPKPRNVVRAWSPHPTIADLKGNGLGMVLVQGGGWEINRTLPGGYPYQKPFDPQYYRRGETGMYYDTMLGAIPTDAELGPPMCYTPVQSAWIYAKEGYVAPPYVPPNEWRPVAPPYGPPTAPLGATTAADTVVASAAVHELSKHQRRMFYLSALSTAAIVAVASINIVRAMRQKKMVETE